MTKPPPQELAPGRFRKPLLGTWITMVRDTGIMTVLKQAGLSYLRYDMEHTPVGLDVVPRLVEAASKADIGLCIRPPKGDGHWISALVEMGVRDLYVPQVHTARAAGEIAAAARRAQAKLPAGAKVHIAVMLESIRAFRNITEIARVEGIDTLAIGPADLAQELGVYGTYGEASAADEYRFAIRDAATANGKEWEMGAWSESDMARWIAAGCRRVTYQTETMILRERYLAVAAIVANINRERRVCA